MSHYLGVTVWSAFPSFCLFVCRYLSCLSVCLAVCISYLSVCVHNLVLYFAICIWAYGQNTINHLKSEVLDFVLTLAMLTIALT